MKLFLLAVFLIGVIFVSGCYLKNVIVFGNVAVNVEIADSDEERMKGLMFRKFLDEDKGMLFVFDDSLPRAFWMKNTLIPLDIIFISEDLRIINIAEAEPCQKEPCEVYYSQGNAEYVLEVNKGFSKKFNISVGNEVDIRMQKIDE